MSRVETSTNAFESGRRADYEMVSADPFRRPDPSVLNAAIPLFFIGRNRDGLWVARDADASSGGLFLLRSSAMRFVQHQRRLFTPAIIERPIPFELDTPNSGNRYAARLAALRRRLLNLVRAARRVANRLSMRALTPLRTVFYLLAARRIHLAAVRLTARP